MKNKLLFIDVESSGLDPDNNGVIQVAMLYGKRHELSLFSNPIPLGVEIDKEASEIHGYKKKDIKKFPNHEDQFNKMLNFMAQFVNKYDKRSKFLVVGYNVKFDLEMLHGWARREGFNYLGSYLDWRVIDVLVLARTAHELGQMPGEPVDFKLQTICKVYGIEIEAHDALNDIKATRELYEKIIKGWL